MITVNPEFPEFDKISYCAKVIRQGGLVVLPTETVYGIAADYNNLLAMNRLREVKRRSQDKPFSILISQIGLISNYSSMTKPVLFKVIDAFWPGPLTVIVPKKGQEGTMGIRMPQHEIALNLVQESQCTIAAPSANFEGNHSPTTCREALRDLDGLVDVAIDGGTASIGISSSVVDFTQEHPMVLREGSIKQEDIDRAAKKKTVLFVCTGNSCRSVMGEFLLRKMLKDQSEVEVYSAGTGVYFKTSASAETIAVLKKEGIDASQHQSQQLTSLLLKKSDLILVMTRLHRQQVLERVPEVESRVYLLREFSNMNSFGSNLDIPDPIGKPAEAYEECSMTIKEAVDRVVQLL